MKKFIFILILIIASIEVYSFPTIEDLWNIALENNLDIITSENKLRSAEISAKTLDAFYSPSVSLSNQNTTNEGKSITDIPLNTDTYIKITQPIPGGTSLSVTGDYSFNTAEYESDTYISQSLKLSFSLTQSLFPFWLQGTVKDPVKLNGTLQRDYYFYSKEYTKKKVFQEIIQNYAYALIYKNKMMSYSNTIDLVKKQIDALRQLQKTGGTNIAKITELENNKWTYEQDLISCKISYESYLQTIKKLCGNDIEFNDDIYELINVKEMDELSSLFSDPLNEQYILQIEMLKNENILNKQNNAPTLNISIVPQWNLETQKKEEWKDAWDLKGPSNWTTALSLDFSPLISSSIKNTSKQNDIEIDNILVSYEAYKNQKEFVKGQYEKLIQSFEKQREEVITLYDKAVLEERDLNLQVQKGAISSLDYESNVCQLNNCKLSKDCVEIYIWLYKILLELV